MAKIPEHLKNILVDERISLTPFALKLYPNAKTIKVATATFSNKLNLTQGREFTEEEVTTIQKELKALADFIFEGLNQIFPTDIKEPEQPEAQEPKTDFKKIFGNKE